MKLTLFSLFLDFFLVFVGFYFWGQNESSTEQCASLLTLEIGEKEPCIYTSWSAFGSSHERRNNPHLSSQRPRCILTSPPLTRQLRTIAVVLSFCVSLKLSKPEELLAGGVQLSQGTWSTMTNFVWLSRFNRSPDYITRPDEEGFCHQRCCSHLWDLRSGCNRFAEWDGLGWTMGGGRCGRGPCEVGEVSWGGYELRPAQA